MPPDASNTATPVLNPLEVVVIEPVVRARRWPGVNGNRNVAASESAENVGTVIVVDDEVTNSNVPWTIDALPSIVAAIGELRETSTIVTIGGSVLIPSWSSVSSITRVPATLVR